MVSLSFENVHLRQIFEDEEMAVSILGSVATQELYALRFELIAFRVVGEVSTILRTIRNVGNSAGAIEYMEGHIVVFRSNQERTPEVNGVPDWNSINRIQVIDVT